MQVVDLIVVEGTQSLRDGDVIDPKAYQANSDNK